MSTYLEIIERESEAFADAIAASPAQTPVPTCPGWTLQDLGVHLGTVQRWARLAVLTAQPPDEAAIDAPPAGTTDDLAAWVVQGARDLVVALGSVEPDAPTWHPFPVPQVAAIWPRRQAHEVTIHRWDAQHAAGRPGAIDPLAASDFVGEYFEVVVPRVQQRDGRVPPAGHLHVDLTDTGVTYDVVFGDSATTAEATLAAPAADVLLALWRRQSLAPADRSPLADEWMAFGGN